MDRTEITGVLFHPRAEAKNPTPPDAVDAKFEVADGISLGCRLFSRDKKAPTLIFFHGNAETVSDYDELGPYYLQQGLNIFFTDYRGYGWSDGTPLTSTFLPDSNALFLRLKEWLKAEGYTGCTLRHGAIPGQCQCHRSGRQPQ